MGQTARQGPRVSMARRSRIRRILKWTGVGVSGVVLLVWLTSVWFWVGYFADGWSIRLGDGVVRYEGVPGWLSTRPKGWFRLTGRSPSWSAFNDEIGRLVFSTLPVDHLTTHPEIVRQQAWKQLARRLGFIEPSYVLHNYALDKRSLASRVSMWRVPMWMVFLLVVAPTALFWWRDRRYPPGHCQRCGYNLTGNVSGKCPECGKPIKPHTE